MPPVTCEVCNLSMHKNILATHVTSKKHLKKLWCQVCEIQTTSLKQLQTHNQSRNHSAKVKQKADQAQKAKKNAKGDEKKPATKRKADLQSYQDTADVKREPKLPKVVIPTGTYSCELCGIPNFTSLSQQQKHIEGKKHQLKAGYEMKDN